MWWTDNWPMPWMFFGPIMMIIFLIVCAAVMFYMMRGEISQTEFEERRRILEAH